ncbi:MAG TPA: sodium/glutamate symporter [Bryobacteraceae bacterium]|nr:sodium/glutamate symporter [Bryobacteraceae bacterium]
MTVVKLNAIQVLALSCFGLVMGSWLKRRLPVLDYLNIPAAIIGGLIYASLILVLRDRVVNFEMDLVLQGILMITFFTTIGMSASLGLVRKGGPQVLLFFVIATVGAVLQNVLGIGLANVFGLNPLLGIISGSVALTGGPATALSFGPTFEGLGVAGATTLGVSSAMFGITAGGLSGGFIGGRLIDRYRLQARPVPGPSAEQLLYADASEQAEPSRIADESDSEESVLLRNVIVIAIAMGLGSIISGWFTANQIVLPAYIGAMMAASVIRNLDDKWRFAGISQSHVDTIGNISLSMFIVMALLTLRLWELVHLAGPMFGMLFGQIVLVVLMCVGVFFLMGRDYESAVMAGGFSGFMLGTTANAMACMSVLREKYGPAPRAFIVVPLVGASLIDFTNAAIITQMANLFK